MKGRRFSSRRRTRRDYADAKIEPMRRPKDDDDILVRSTGCKCGKLTFSNRKIAKKIAKQFRSRLGTRFGTYRCPHCGDWHLYTIKPRPDLRIHKNPVPA